MNQVTDHGFVGFSVVNVPVKAITEPEPARASPSTAPTPTVGLAATQKFRFHAS